jgi:site-specific DNA recombinase
MKVAIYVRVSSDRQAEKELSIPAQIKAIQQHCQERGYIIVNEFVEKGKSAKSDDRPEFQRMIALSKRSNRPFDAILVHKFDRFSRKRDDQVIYKALLSKVGVKVISVTEQTEAETPQDMLLEGMLEVMSEFFNANLATEVRKGMTQNAKQGYNNGGTPPYGYRTEHIALGNQKTKAVWVLGPREEIDIIRWIFNQYAYENAGYKKIANGLNEKGVPTQKGGQWSASTIRAIIFNESYIGRKIWNKQDYQTKGKKWKDRSEWVITENAHPSIITKELFNLCQERAKSRNNGGGEAHKPFQLKANSPYWLKGMMYCDKCGSRMLGHTTSTTKTYGGQKYYICGGYMRKGKGYCEYVGWRKETIERVAAIKLRNVFLRLTMGQNLRDELSLYHADQNKHAVSEIHILKSEIAYLRNRVETLRQDISSGKAKPYHSDMLLDLEDEMQTKEQHLAQLSGHITHPDIQEPQIESIKQDLHLIINLLDSDGANPQSLNQSLSKYVSRIVVQRENKHISMTVQINMNGETMYEKTIVADMNFTIS